MDRLWTDFVNSDYHDWRGGDRSEDRLGKAGWQQDFLNRWQLEAQVSASTEEESAMRIFRDKLQSLAIRLSAGTPLTEKDQAWLNDSMRCGGVIRQLIAEDQRLDVKLVPVHAHWFQVMAEVAADFAITLVEGDGKRIRCCDNPDCRWIFYDDTRSRTQKYCDDKMCGNLMKVRRFRAKRKLESNGDKNEV
nr:CGNR zinc finger domain-containing protein [Paenibacillus xylanexedens]